MSKEKAKTSIDSFLNYNSAPDILAATTPIQKISKEISEAMAIKNQIKNIIIKATKGTKNDDIQS